MSRYHYEKDPLLDTQRRVMAAMVVGGVKIKNENGGSLWVKSIMGEDVRANSGKGKRIVMGRLDRVASLDRIHNKNVVKSQDRLNSRRSLMQRLVITLKNNLVGRGNFVPGYRIAVGFSKA